ncbi:MAG: 30S ribosomal protein S21 [Myxococcales bacterium]|nr:30S ribosomal protein S21 [Myxococcales bacterium]
MVLVTVRDNEPFEKALRRFRRKVEREGIRKDIKKNSFYLKPGEKRRLKQRLAEKRRRKAARRATRKMPSKPPPAGSTPTNGPMS